MNIHKNARLTPQGREILVRRMLEEGLRVEEAAQASGVSVHTACKWRARYRAQGLAGLQGRSSRPHHTPHRTGEGCRAAIQALRRARCTYREISRTVGRIVQQAGLNRWSSLEPPVAVHRYVYPHPGDLVHLDIKRLGRFRRPGHRVTGNRRLHSPGAGWEYVHVAIDDHSRVSFADLRPTETAHSATRALLAALRYFKTLGITCSRVMTDNGACYRSLRFAQLCRRLRRTILPNTNNNYMINITLLLHNYLSCPHSCPRLSTVSYQLTTKSSQSYNCPYSH